MTDNRFFDAIGQDDLETPDFIDIQVTDLRYAVFVSLEGRKFVLNHEDARFLRDALIEEL